MLLYNVIMIVIVTLTSRWVFIFVTIAYKIKVIMIFVVLRSILFSLLFIFFSVNESAFSRLTSIIKYLRVEKITKIYKRRFRQWIYYAVNCWFH
jgi:hypothetical protein